VGMTGTARPYASCLTRLAAIRAAAPQLAPGALARRPQISIRVEALLERGRDRGRRSSRGALAAAAATLTAAAFVAAPLAPVTVALPAAPRLAASNAPVAARSPLPLLKTMAQAPPPARARLHGRSRPPARHNPPPAMPAAVARDFAPLSGAPTSAAPVPAALPAFQAPPMTLYVVFVDGGDAGWIRILWVHQVSNQPLNRT